MNNQKRLLACAVLAFFSVGAVASEIYKRVNSDGVAEFSDKPFPGAQQVTVNPNVVATNPTQRRVRPPAADAAESSAPASVPGAAVRDTQTNDYVRARERRAIRARENRREDPREQRRRSVDEEASDPNPGRAIRNATRNVSRR